MRIKGRYVALVEIDIDFEQKKDMVTFHELKKRTTDGFLTDCIRDVIKDEVIDDYAKVTVTQQYADLYEVEEDD